MAKVLLVEDDKQLCALVSDWLAHQNYVVECVYTGTEAHEFLSMYQYDVIVLDWALPDVSGLEVLQKFRANGGATPVLILTGKRSIREKEQGLDGGADDYLTKPFDVKELSARLRALLRRTPSFSNDILTVGHLRLDPQARHVTLAGQTVKLYPKDFALLEYLMRYPNKVFSSEQLLDAVWTADTEAGTETIRTSIKRLRKSLEREGQPQMIDTVHGVGYKLTSPQ